MSKDYVFQATLEEDDVIRAILNIEKSVNQMAEQADKKFQKMQSSVKKSGESIDRLAAILKNLLRWHRHWWINTVRI